MGPVLHVGCGDAPVPEQLQRAGFERSEHIDVEPQVIQVMLKRYPLEQWPGGFCKVTTLRGAKQGL